MPRLLPLAAFAAGLVVFALPAQAVPLVRRDDVRSPSLLLDSGEPGLFIEAANSSTDVEVVVSGVVVETRVRQRFSNTGSTVLDGIYVFPLPEGAAVHELRFEVNGRVIEGLIQEKKEAEKTFEQAKAEGKKATLLVQERPDLFNTRLTGIGPGEHIDVVIGLQDVVRYEAGTASLRFPTGLTPRYTPAGSTALTTETLPASTFSLRADVEAGFAIAAVSSAHHAITTTRNPSGVHVETAGVMDRGSDFTLSWTAAPMLAPNATVLTEKVGDDTYGLVLVSPPTVVDNDVRVSRETIFVLDTSGSMAGPSMEQARKAMQHGLATLLPIDRFNIIEFDDDFSTLFKVAERADAKHLAAARTFIAGLKADGGTEMAEALARALQPDVNDDNLKRVRQILFVTDGAVSNEDQLLRSIQTGLGESRLFTVAIGGAPNASFMTKAAELGRGTFTFIGNTNEVEEKMGELFSKIESPVLSNIALSVPPSMQQALDRGQIEMWPRTIGDLYVGEPVVVAFKAIAGVDMSTLASLTLHAKAAGKPLEMKLELPAASADRGLHRLWARRKIEHLLDLERAGVGQHAAIVALGIKHRLVTPYTSLVAVDSDPPRLADGRIELGNTLPKGGTATNALLGAGLSAVVAGLLLRRRRLPLVA